MAFIRPAALAAVALTLSLGPLADRAAAQGGALRFDGVDDLAVALDAQNDFDMGVAFTLEAWVQFDAANPGGGIIGGQIASGGAAWVMGGGIGTPTSAVLSVSTPATDAVFAPGAIVPGPMWSHFAGTWDGTLMTFYIDGVQVAQSAHPSPGPTSSVDQLIFGRFPVQSTLFLGGAVDEVRLWNVVRTPAEILAAHAQQVPGNAPGLVGYYKFDEPGGDVILDSSARGNDGFLGATQGAGADDPTRIVSTAPIGPGPIGTTYCAPSVANSTGNPATIEASGSSLVADNDVTLTASDLPAASFGFFLTSRTQGSVAQPGGSQGVLCLGGSIGRYVGPNQVQNSGSAGTFSLLIDLNQHPTPTGLVIVQPGETWNFQAWYRDSIGGAATSNFTDGREVTFN